MRYLNTKNIIAAGVLLSCMSSIAWGAIIPDRTRIIMNESDKGEWICPYISRHLLSLNPLQARCRRYSRGER